MTTTLITGANKGLGYVTAERLLADVTDDASVKAAADTVDASGGLDVLVNNAGIAGGRTPVAQTTAADLRRVFETNVLGAAQVLHAFTDLLEASPVPVVVNVSSGLGSISHANDPDGPYADFNFLAYPASKAALTCSRCSGPRLTPSWRVNAADPGFTTSMITEEPRPSRKVPTPLSDLPLWPPTVRRVRSRTVMARAVVSNSGRGGTRQAAGHEVLARL